MLNSTMDKLHKRCEQTKFSWPNNDKYYECENNIFSSKWDQDKSWEKSVEWRQEQEFSLLDKLSFNNHNL
jgi:hypothetical protein